MLPARGTKAVVSFGRNTFSFGSSGKRERLEPPLQQFSANSGRPSSPKGTGFPQVTNRKSGPELVPIAHSFRNAESCIISRSSRDFLSPTRSLHSFLSISPMETGSAEGSAPTTPAAAVSQHILPSTDPIDTASKPSSKQRQRTRRACYPCSKVCDTCRR